MSVETVLLVLILIAGFYMAWNIGANDVANAMGTSVGSGALNLKQAVIIAAFLEFSGAFFFGSHVSETVQKGIIDPDLFIFNPRTLVYGMFSSLLAAGAWLQIASYFGLPVSTTHTIVGAVVGFGAIVGGLEAVHWNTVGFIVSSWVISPLAGGALGYYLFTILRKRIFYNFNPVEEAKKLTPIIVFVVIITLSLILLIDGLKHFHPGISFFQALGASAIIGGIGSAVSAIYVRRIRVNPSLVSTRPKHGSNITYSLDKVKKHLQRIEEQSEGELKFRSSALLEEAEEISSALKKTREQEVSSSEYQSVEKIFSYLQILSASMMAFSHGANDVANAIGPLAAAVGILTTGVVAMQMAVPLWALALGGAGIVIGLATWGWRVMETIGRKLTELTPTRGFAAEFGAAATILIASQLGMPISTTHTLVGAVIGVGMARGIEALNLALMRDIIVSWIITVPAGAFFAVVFFYVIQWAFS